MSRLILPELCPLPFPSSLIADLWIISDSPWFGEAPNSKIMFAKSTWFGPSKDNVIELDRIFGDPPLQTPVFAMVP